MPIALESRDPEQKGPHIATFLAWWHISSGCFLEQTVCGERGENLCKILLNLHLPFAPADFAHGSMPDRMATRYPVLEHSIAEPLQRATGSTASATAAELCDWVLDNIRLPKGMADQLRKARLIRRP